MILKEIHSIIVGWEQKYEHEKHEKGIAVQ